MPRLPKYGRIAPRINATKGPKIVPGFATYLPHPAPGKAAGMRIWRSFFPTEVSKIGIYDGKSSLSERRETWMYGPIRFFRITERTGLPGIHDSILT